ncbi:BTB/POZ and MATH domain-containing protein 2-like [Setaria italica]|uniref:BTB/POZ and MATH domain-containing protein 2-like n=1 Tax=Setaria italica TaxID=4555 RepID=UPI000BE57519|nr:BTB/POZ and MATH domain-containing protein 2-like [Setaria italica]
MANNSTSAPKHGQYLSKTTSRCVAGSVTAMHDFVVTSFSLIEGMGTGKFVSSATFTVGGRDWNIKLYPDGIYTEHKGYASVLLYFLKGAAEIRAPKLLPPKDDSFTIKCVLTVVDDPHTQDVSASTVIVPQSKLHQDLSHMLKNGEGADVTFSVGAQLFPAHKCMLAARSTVFKAEFFGAMKERDDQCIKIDDMEPTIFEALLYFVYTDSLPDGCSSDENTTMQHLLVAADRYRLERLRVMCEDKLRHGVDAQTVATTLALAKQHNCAQLKDACIRFIASRDILDAIMETDGFRHLEESCPLIREEISDKVATFRSREDESAATLVMQE